MARRGFFAELQHQSRVTARERERDERDAVRRHVAAVTRTEQAKKDWERAQAQLAKAADSERKRLEKEAREAHVAAMEAEVIEGGFKFHVQRVNTGAMAHRLPGAWRSSDMFSGAY